MFNLQVELVKKMRREDGSVWTINTLARFFNVKRVVIRYTCTAIECMYLLKGVFFIIMMNDVIQNEVAGNVYAFSYNAIQHLCRHVA